MGRGGGGGFKTGEAGKSCITPTKKGGGGGKCFSHAEGGHKGF